jgi:hypothetical protein
MNLQRREKDMSKLTVNFFEDVAGKKEYPNAKVLTITKTKEKWIDELTEYMLELAYQDGEFANGLLDDLLRGGFKGYWSMSDKELTEEIVTQIEHLYDKEVQDA